MPSGICFNEVPKAKSKPQRGTRPDAGPEPDFPVAIDKAVGAGGANVAKDVVQIQRGLNHVLPELAGADPFLNDDGIVGPMTLGAIKKFQERNFGWFDSRVDPNNKTIALINHYLATQPVPNAPHSRQDRVARALLLLRTCGQTIFSAETQLRAVLPHVDAGTTPSGVFGKIFEERMALLDRHFKLNEFLQKAPVIRTLITRYTDMRSVIQASVPANPDPEFLFSEFMGDEPFVLDAHGSDANAYTFMGGWRQRGQLHPPSGRRLDRIYLCESLDRTSDQNYEQVVVHELAHFVSLLVPPITDLGYGWINDPRMTRLSATQRVCNAQNYTTYAIECRYGQRNNRLGL
ncbi:MAG TPA: hypothetical protein VFE62_19155 [Gemmataceae bacterium]|nr:hypothetical protein [Gemmataceae bacterium]